MGNSLTKVKSFESTAATILLVSTSTTTTERLFDELYSMYSLTAKELVFSIYYFKCGFSSAKTVDIWLVVLNAWVSNFITSSS